MISEEVVRGIDILKFKVVTLLIGLMCMCFSVFCIELVFAQRSYDLVNPSFMGDMTIGQKTVQKLKNIKKELIICAASAVGFGLGLLLFIPFDAFGPIPEKDLTFIGKVANNLWPPLVIGSPLLGLGALISTGVKLCS